MITVIQKSTAASLLALSAASFSLFSCSTVEQNTLTQEEIADGWQLLFDGKTLNFDDRFTDSDESWLLINVNSEPRLVTLGDLF